MRFPALIAFSLALLVTACQSGLPETEYRDMQQQVLSLDRSLSADEDYLRTAATFHQAWMAEKTDSSVSPAAYARFASDSSYRVKVLAQDQQFDQWFSHYLFLSREMRIQVNDMRNWLLRLEEKNESALRVRRSFTSRLEDYLRSSQAYRSVSSRYQEVKAGYGIGQGTSAGG